MRSFWFRFLLYWAGFVVSGAKQCIFTIHITILKWTFMYMWSTNKYFYPPLNKILMYPACLQVCTLLYGLYLAWAVRGVTLPTMNESPCIAASSLVAVLLASLQQMLSVWLADHMTALNACAVVIIWIVTTVTLTSLYVPKVGQNTPTDTRCNDNIIILSKRCCDVVSTYKWRHYCTVCLLGLSITWLSNWGRDITAVILQTSFCNANVFLYFD